MNECKIIQDLLPSYIDGITSEETKRYIENHIQGCSDCKETLENMKKDIKINDYKKDGREIKYLKRFKKKLTTLKLILLFLVIFFVGFIGEKIYIVTYLSNKAEQYINTNNYHYTHYFSYLGEYKITDIYYIDGRAKIVYEQKLADGTKRNIVEYGKEIIKSDTKGIEDTYLEDMFLVNENIAMLDMEGNMTARISNSIKIDNVRELFKYAFLTQIRKTEYNGEECYYITNEYGGAYYSRETGLIIGQIYENSEGGDTSLSEQWVYEFGAVTEDDLKEPDISNYEVHYAK